MAQSTVSRHLRSAQQELGWEQDGDPVGPGAAEAASPGAAKPERAEQAAERGQGEGPEEPGGDDGQRAGQEEPARPERAAEPEGGQRAGPEEPAGPAERDEPAPMPGTSLALAGPRITAGTVESRYLGAMLLHAFGARAG